MHIICITTILLITTQLFLTSPAFPHQLEIPYRFTKNGRNMSPPLKWGDAPNNTASFALILEDPTNITAGNVTHWICWNIPANMTEIREDISEKKIISLFMVQGTNDFGKLGYYGPNSIYSRHKYVFHLYALNDTIALTNTSTRADLDLAMHDKIIDEAVFKTTFMDFEAIRKMRQQKYMQSQHKDSKADL